MTQIIGFAGRKQSGKDTACNFILAAKIAELGISKSTRLTNTGEIEVTDILDDSISGQEWMPFKPPYVNVDDLFSNELGKFIKRYSFAEKLKRMAVDVLGIKEEQAFGTDEQKNTHTHIQWESIPGNNAKSQPPGPMTGREVLQYLGTDIFRSMYQNVWVDACLRQIQEDAPEVALVSDVRFDNEIKAIQEQGGFVIGLTRNPYKASDMHESETQIGECLQLCDAVIENDNLSIPQQNEQIYLAIKDLNYMTEMI